MSFEFGVSSLRRVWSKNKECDSKEVYKYFLLFVLQ